MRELTKAIHKPGMVVQDLGGEMLLYSAAEEAIHILNPTAWHIWNLCDGEHTMEEIEQTIRANFTVPCEQDVRGDIKRMLETFTGKGLLEVCDQDGKEIPIVEDKMEI